MTIDEAIEHARDVAKSNIGMYKSHVRMSIKDNTEKFNNPSCLKCAEEHEQLVDWLEQLKEYQQLEEQGRLIKLPCKVGDTVWDIDFGFPTPCYISAFSLGECEDYIYDPISGKEIVFYHSGRFTGSFLMSEIGKTVFLTKSEAESKLKELRGDEQWAKN